MPPEGAGAIIDGMATTPVPVPTDTDHAAERIDTAPEPFDPIALANYRADDEHRTTALETLAPPRDAAPPADPPRSTPARRPAVMTRLDHTVQATSTRDTASVMGRPAGGRISWPTGTAAYSA